MTMVLKSEYGMKQDAYEWSKTSSLGVSYRVWKSKIKQIF